MLLRHVRKSWADGAPTDEQLKEFLRLLRLIKFDAQPGQPEYASSVATFGTVAQFALIPASGIPCHARRHSSDPNPRVAGRHAPADDDRCPPDLG